MRSDSIWPKKLCTTLSLHCTYIVHRTNLSFRFLDPWSHNKQNDIIVVLLYLSLIHSMRLISVKKHQRKKRYLSFVYTTVNKWPYLCDHLSFCLLHDFFLLVTWWHIKWYIRDDATTKWWMNGLINNGLNKNLQCIK